MSFQQKNAKINTDRDDTKFATPDPCVVGVDVVGSGGMGSSALHLKFWFYKKHFNEKTNLSPLQKQISMSVMVTLWSC